MKNKAEKPRSVPCLNWELDPGVDTPRTPHCPSERDSVTEEVVETWSKGTPEFPVAHWRGRRWGPGPVRRVLGRFLVRLQPLLTSDRPPFPRPGAAWTRRAPRFPESSECQDGSRGVLGRARSLGCRTCGAAQATHPARQPWSHFLIGTRGLGCPPRPPPPWLRESLAAGPF